MSKIFTVYNHDDAARVVGTGLSAIQHGGPLTCGIAAGDEKEKIISKWTGFGQVTKVFPAKEIDKIMSGLGGRNALGHVSSKVWLGNKKNLQPITINHSSRGPLAIAYEGGIKNAARLRVELATSLFATDSDIEIILHLIVRSKQPTLRAALAEVLGKVEGAYCIVLMSADEVLVARDHSAVWSLWLAKLNGATVVASETCAFDLLGATKWKEFPPGKVVSLRDLSFTEIPTNFQPQPMRCLVEQLYFLRPDSLSHDGVNLETKRIAIGKRLAQVETLVFDPNNSVVIPAPASGNAIAMGYAEELGLLYDPFGLIKNHYSHTTLVEPHVQNRDFNVKVKLNTNKDVVEGKIVIVIDDSTVRGTTARTIVKLLMEAGAKEVHVRIGSPPRQHWCFFDTNTPPESELLAPGKTTQQICEELGANSFASLKSQPLRKACGDTEGASQYCTICMDKQSLVRITR